MPECGVNARETRVLLTSRQIELGHSSQNGVRLDDVNSSSILGEGCATRRVSGTRKHALLALGTSKVTLHSGNWLFKQLFNHSSRTKGVQACRCDLD